MAWAFGGFYGQGRCLESKKYLGRWDFCNLKGESGVE